jgi:hypothetical protein
VETDIKVMRDKKATGDNNVPGNVLRLLGEMVSENGTNYQQHV